MSMRLKMFDFLPGLKIAVAPGRPAVPGGRAVFGGLRTIWSRVGEEARKRPKLAALIGTTTGTWATLVESFASMIDPYLSRYFPHTRLVALVTASGGVELHQIVQGAVTPLGPLATIVAPERTEIEKSKWTAIELRLRPDQLLQRTLSLPATSRDFLGPIIEHKLERLTPWRPERVLYGYQVLPSVEPTSGVNVILTATSKDFLAAPLQALKEAGLVPTAIGPVQETLSDPLRLNLLRDAAKGGRIDSRRVVSRVALTLFGLLLAADVASSLWASTATNQQRDADIRFMKARRLLKTASMGAVGDRERSLLESKQPEKSMVVLVDKLAEAIPDDTYLKEFAVTLDKVRLVGTSGNAPTLIGKLEAAGLVNVRFASAVTRGKDQKDSFEITADRAAPVEADSR